MSRNNVIVVGAVPPPIGGVTIHVLRLISSLESLGCDFEFINLRMRTKDQKIDFKRYINNVLRVMKSRDTSVIHYQLNNLFELALFVIISMIIRSRIITTVHSFRPEVFSGTKRMLFQIITRSKTEFIAPSITIKQALILHGVKKEKIKVINTFLPPSASEINKELPMEIMEFVKKRDKIVVGNAYKLYLDDFGMDVYGLDMCIEACKAIPESNFIFCVPLIDDQNYYKKCINKINEYKVSERFLILNKEISLVSILKHADVFVRPTSTDSFGVSVAEALAMGVPAIASDVCERAEGAVTFKSRDQNEFNRNIRRLLMHETGQKRELEAKGIIRKYLELYELSKTVKGGTYG